MTTWYTCSPVVDYWDQNGLFEQSREISDGIRIEPVPDWFSSENARDWLNWGQREKYTSTGRVICLEYEAEALGSPVPGLPEHVNISAQDLAQEKIALASIAFWFARPSNFSTESIFHFEREEDELCIRQSAGIPRLIPHEDYRQTALQEEDVAKGSHLLEKMLALPRDETLFTAMWTFRKALTERLWAVRYLLEWVVLESLFGPDNPGETRYRISHRIGLYLGNTKNEAKEICKKTRKGYDWRSKIAHGLRLHNLEPDQAASLGLELEKVIQAAFLKILENEDHREIFNGRQREDFLDNLVFN
jgi:hypothetical protein